MKEKKQSDLSILLGFAGKYKGLTFLGLGLSGVAMALGMVPYICVWMVIRELIAVAPNWQEATGISRYGWLTFWAVVAGIVVYFFALMCTHMSAFRIASNIRKEGMRRLMKAPLGFFDNNASGLLRNKLNAAASETETLLAHNIADMVGSIVMFVGMIVMMFVFDWRMGAACLLAAVISIGALCYMMAGKNASMVKEYYAAQDEMSKAGTEYIRGIPVVKVFQQTVYSFKAFKDAIEDYSNKAEKYSVGVCGKPQTLNLTATEGAFVFLIPVAVLLAPKALATGNFAGFITDFAFYAVFSAIVSTALARIMFAVSGMMLASSAVSRFSAVMNAPQLPITAHSKAPQDNSVEFRHVSFTYEGADLPALKDVSFTVQPGQTIALVGPSGGGKTTAASLIPRFWDATEGSVLVGGVDVRDMDPHTLMDQIAFVFQNNHLFKATILENVRAAKLDASKEQVLAALHAAQCDDIIAKLPQGVDTMIGSEGTYLSGGEQQRVALARAILKDAPIIVLDEATAFADPENEVLIQKAFAYLTKDRTVIMIAHRLSTVVGADKILVLDDGRITEEGTHDALVSKDGFYAHLWSEYNRAVQWKIVGAEGV